MIISIRYLPSGQWQWELYDIGREIAHATGKYAQGTALTWANMIHNLELSVAELEKRHELSE